MMDHNRQRRFPGFEALSTLAFPANFCGSSCSENNPRKLLNLKVKKNLLTTPFFRRSLPALITTSCA
jgi:hypothetical protein